jgi:hypothetical protein
MIVFHDGVNDFAHRQTCMSTIVPNFIYQHAKNQFATRYRHDCMVVGFTTTCAISTYHH